MRLTDYILFLFLWGCVASTDQANQLNVESKEKRSTRDRRGDNPISRGVREDFQRLFENGDLNAFTPAPLRPEEVECQVGVEETVYHDGRCISLGSSRRHACQSGRQLELYNTECVRQSDSGRGNGGRRQRGGNQRRRGTGRRTGGRQ
ncbi:hypothetical protein SNE40_005539 [Patella caerulea]|uniref:Secreted protein n=1 Tax=Patella caerulea TaxID=87958 RepID=A0AAN8K468_PATCE